ncbi:hypothetical protein [Bradyrhizobium sp. HKCCYLS20291]|uniref:hypothetical protein n=1 Tax=Bradyrhizobium sp. HKCCYLS20291 TaxID=3420766 RepID=UPI003EBD7752
MVNASIASLVDDRVENEPAELGMISARIGELEQNFHRLVAHQREVLGKVLEESARLADRIIELIGLDPIPGLRVSAPAAGCQARHVTRGPLRRDSRSQRRASRWAVTA